MREKYRKDFNMEVPGVTVWTTGLKINEQFSSSLCEIIYSPLLFGQGGWLHYNKPRPTMGLSRGPHEEGSEGLHWVVRVSLFGGQGASSSQVASMKSRGPASDEGSPHHVRQPT